MVIANPNLPANKDVLNQFGYRPYIVFEINHEKYNINMPFNVDLSCKTGAAAAAPVLLFISRFRYS